METNPPKKKREKREGGKVHARTDPIKKGGAKFTPDLKGGGGVFKKSKQ